MHNLFHTSNSPDSSPLEVDPPEVRGTLERITFYNEANGYLIGRLLPDGARDVVTITGTFSHPVVGEHYVCRGVWTRHQQFGKQLQVRSYETIRPVTSDAIEKYLGSGMVKGVGPVTAKRIVAHFGERSLDIIEKSPDDLLTIPGIGAKTVGIIKSAWGEQSDVRNIMIFLQSHGVSPNFAAKIYKTYQSRSIEIVENNPYRLASDIWGVGFKMADQIAQNLGFAKEDIRRLEAGVVYVLTRSVETGGNVYLTLSELTVESAEILGPVSIDAAYQNLVAKGQLIKEVVEYRGNQEIGIYTPELYNAEKSLASRLLKLLSHGPMRSANDQIIDFKPMSRNQPELSDQQRNAVRLASDSRVLALTGGPGVGKTTTTNAIVRGFKARGKDVLLASPTGRAAKRLSEVTGEEAVTIHRLLAYDPQRREFQRNIDSPLHCDLLLIDESSMLDTLLTNAVLLALPERSQLILVGDIDQLPSVGPGNVLSDIINSGVVPVARLTQVFRQAAQSMIISGAHAINEGHIPRLASPREQGADFIFVESDDAAELADKIVAIVTRSLIRRGYLTGDIQVLTPMQRGSAGSVELNARLQTAINPPAENKPEIKRGMRIFRLGDRVIQLKNNYDKQVYNGDIGLVTTVNVAEIGVTVKYDNREVTYEFTDTDELGLAYSLSIHKSQGSEFPVAVIALHTQHYTLLQRNLIYTALTRAKKLAVLVGSKKALSIAVGNNQQNNRHTRLRERLQGLL